MSKEFKLIFATAETRIRSTDVPALFKAILLMVPRLVEVDSI